MDRAEILAFIDEVYGPPGQYEAENSGAAEHLADRMRKLRAFVMALPPDRPFALVAAELWLCRDRVWRRRALPGVAQRAATDCSIGTALAA